MIRLLAVGALFGYPIAKIHRSRIKLFDSPSQIDHDPEDLVSKSCLTWIT